MKHLLVLTVAVLVALPSFAGPPKPAIKTATIITPGSIYFPRYSLLTNQVAKLQIEMEEWAVIRSDLNKRYLLKGQADLNRRTERAELRRIDLDERLFRLQKIAACKLDLLDLEELAKRSAAIPR